MKKVKYALWLVLFLLVYMGLIYLPLILVPKLVKAILTYFCVPQSNFSMIASLVTALIFFAFSSNKMYIFLHKKYVQWIEGTKIPFLKIILATFISANDVWVAIPKRTALFSVYLIYSILDKLGYVDYGVDVIFVGVFIIGIDRVAKSWKDEKKKMFSLGKKAYSEETRITDSIIS